uniref:Uncharacterized protein n=1 Tax=Plectus sambesii TaxID=2011161 RepID=A0A914VKF0_9BILA
MMQFGKLDAVGTWMNLERVFCVDCSPSAHAAASATVQRRRNDQQRHLPALGRRRCRRRWGRVRLLLGVGARICRRGRRRRQSGWRSDRRQRLRQGRLRPNRRNGRHAAVMGPLEGPVYLSHTNVFYPPAISRPRVVSGGRGGLRELRNCHVGASGEEMPIGEKAHDYYFMHDARTNRSAFSNSSCRRTTEHNHYRSAPLRNQRRSGTELAVRRRRFLLRNRLSADIFQSTVACSRLHAGSRRLFYSARLH